MLVQQHDHALASGEFAGHWAERPWPLEPTLFAVALHDVAWRGPDSEVRWNEDADRPYSFVDYPADLKVRAYEEGLDWTEERDAYAGCLCSMHYATLLERFGGGELEARFVRAEGRRQERLRARMSDAEAESLVRNLDLLRLCDGLSLFVCLNGPGADQYPPPYPGGFRLGETTFEPVWEDERTLRMEPDPFSGPFEIAIAYRVVGRDREVKERGSLDLRIA